MASGQFYIKYQPGKYVEPSWLSGASKYCVKRVYDDQNCAKINEEKTKKSNVLLGFGQQCVNKTKSACGYWGVEKKKYIDSKCTQMDTSQAKNFVSHGECAQDSSGNWVMYRYLTLDRYRSSAVVVRATLSAVFALIVS